MQLFTNVVLVKTRNATLFLRNVLVVEVHVISYELVLLSMHPVMKL
jgi:hypothetical protein